MQIALTHVISPNINDCMLSFRDREPIDYRLAVKQHDNYCSALRELGLEVIELSVNSSFPDCTFIEDTAVVVDEIAIMCRIGTKSREAESIGIEPELAKYRNIMKIQAPATLDGGDVLKIGKKIFVGNSFRTNTEGIESFKNILTPFGYHIIPVPMKDCLHLKSAVTALDDTTILACTKWLDTSLFSDYKIIDVPDSEAHAANSLYINGTVIVHEGYPETINILKNNGLAVKTVDISELLKAESGLTCSSIIFKQF